MSRGPEGKPIRKLRCAVYTRKSTEEGLDKEFNSLQAQREACEAYIASQRSEGWALVRDAYNDGGFSGGTLERPGLQQLLADIEEGLEQEFNSLQAQREACEAFITSQRHEGWGCLRTGYDDGGFSGATMRAARPLFR